MKPKQELQMKSDPTVQANKSYALIGPVNRRLSTMLGFAFQSIPQLAPKPDQQVLVNDALLFTGSSTFYHVQGHHIITGHSFLMNQIANERGACPNYEQYTIYLFDRILLCCKELNPNKATKDKLMGGTKDKKDKKDKDKKDKNRDRSKSTKLQLKGRIFMQNVTEVISIAKPGKYP